MELVRDSSRSEGELSKILGYSKPTISRMKQRLIESGAVKEFTVIPDFPEIGYEIMAITVGKASRALSSDQQERAKKLIERPNVVFVGSAQGPRGNGVMISFHRNYGDFLDFITHLKSRSFGFMEKVETMLVSLKSDGVMKPFSIATLADTSLIS
jgi:DNA-binding Lrp family transcriptional regulator